MLLHQRAVGTFLNYRTTETALHELKNSGFAMDQVSVVGHDLDRQIEGAGAHASNRLADAKDLNFNENNAVEAAKKGSVAGGTIGGVTGLLVGLAAIAIPGVGPVMLAGAAATTIATALSGGVIGAAAGSLAGGLVGLGIPEGHAKIYNDRVQKGEYLIMVEGSDADITRAHSILSKHGICEWYVYELSSDSVPKATTASPNHPRG